MDGCNFRLPFRVNEKKISEKQYIRLLQKGATVQLKGFKTTTGSSISGSLVFDEQFNVILQKKEVKEKAKPDVLACPKCKKGTILKGNTAYGCSSFNNGCDFKVSFDTIREKAIGKPLTKELVTAILNASV